MRVAAPFVALKAIHSVSAAPQLGFTTGGLGEFVLPDVTANSGMVVPCQPVIRQLKATDFSLSVVMVILVPSVAPSAMR